MEDLKNLTQRFYKEIFANRDLSAADDLIAENMIEHEAPPPGTEMKPGREGVKQLLGVYLDAFNPLTVEVHAQYQEGDTVVSRITFHGTHSGTFAGIEPTGKRLTIEGIDINRFEGDQVAEHWGQFDAVGLLTQLGALPPMD